MAINTKPLISIILPTRNGGRYISESIGSCLRQTYQNLELIVVDDGSTDNTADIVKSFKDERVKYIKHEVSLKLPKALNTGFKYSKGEYLTWTSDDNLYANNALEILANKLISHPDIDFIYSNFFQIDASGKTIKRIKVSGPRNLEMKNCIGACFLYKRIVYEQIGDYSPDAFLAEDYEYWLRANKKFKFKKINNFLYYYRIHPESLSSKYRACKIEKQAQIVSERFVRPSMKLYHLGKVFFCENDYGNASAALVKAILIEPFIIGTWKLLLFIYLRVVVSFFLKIKYKIFSYVVNNTFPIKYLKYFLKNNKGRNCWDGKKSCLSLSFDCDYKEDVKSLSVLLDIFREYPFKASFACVGRLIENFPEEHQRILTDGHEILNHTYTHPNNEDTNPCQKFNELTVDQQMMEIKMCDQICKKILNYSPIGFRTPHFGNLHTDNVYEIIDRLGYKYSSSVLAIKTLSFGMPFRIGTLIEFPVSSCPKHPFAVFDTWHALERGIGCHDKNGDFFNTFKILLDMSIATNSYINVYFDPQDVVKRRDFKKILDYIKEKMIDVKVATYKEIVEKKYVE